MITCYRNVPGLLRILAEHHFRRQEKHKVVVCREKLFFQARHDFFKKVDDLRKQCNKCVKNCSTAQPANTVVKQNIAIFCVKCGQVILEYSMIPSTGANEIHSRYQQQLASYPAGHSLLLHIEFADDKKTCSAF